MSEKTFADSSIYKASMAGETLFKGMSPMEKALLFRAAAKELYVSCPEVNDVLLRPVRDELKRVGRNVWEGPTKLRLTVERPEYACRIIRGWVNLTVGFCA